MGSSLAELIGRQSTTQMALLQAKVVGAPGVGTATIHLGDPSDAISGVRYMSGASFSANDTVWVLRNGNTLIILGKLSSSTWGNPEFREGIELFHPSSTPYVDFHNAASPAGDGNADFAWRVILRNGNQLSFDHSSGTDKFVFFNDGNVHLAGLGVGGDNTENVGMHIHNGHLRIYGADRMLAFHDGVGAGGWYMNGDGTWLRSVNEKGLWLGAGSYGCTGRLLLGTDDPVGAGENIITAGGMSGIRMRQRGRLATDNAFSYVLYPGGDELNLWNAQTAGVSVAFQTNHVTRFQKDANGDWANAAIRSTGATAAIGLHATGGGGWGCCMELWSGDGRIRFYNGGMGWMILHGDFVDESTERVKRDLSDLGATIAKMRKVKAKRFKYKKPEPGDRRWEAYQDYRAAVANGEMAEVNTPWDDDHIGFTAEDVAKVFPEAVTVDSEGRPDGIRYGRLTAVLWNAMVELDARLDELERIAGTSKKGEGS